MQVNKHTLFEAGLANPEVGSRYQFERVGYFIVDPDSSPDKLVFNRIATLRDTWAKIVGAQKYRILIKYWEVIF
jgi:glutaminyl-tRNA synthetase